MRLVVQQGFLGLRSTICRYVLCSAQPNMMATVDIIRGSGFLNPLYTQNMSTNPDVRRTHFS